VPLKNIIDPHLHKHRASIASIPQQIHFIDFLAIRQERLARALEHTKERSTAHSALNYLWGSVPMTEQVSTKKNDPHVDVGVRGFDDGKGKNQNSFYRNSLHSSHQDSRTYSGSSAIDAWYPHPPYW
jgi:hypothetical protein